MISLGERSVDLSRDSALLQLGIIACGQKGGSTRYSDTACQRGPAGVPDRPYAARANCGPTVFGRMSLIMVTKDQVTSVESFHRHSESLWLRIEGASLPSRPGLSSHPLATVSDFPALTVVCSDGRRSYVLPDYRVHPGATRTGAHSAIYVMTGAVHQVESFMTTH